MTRKCIFPFRKKQQNNKFEILRKLHLSTSSKIYINEWSKIEGEEVKIIIRNLSGM